MNNEQIITFTVNSHTHLAAAMQKIDDNANGIVFVVDDDERLCGAVSDGDIRRWILKAGSIDVEVECLMNRNPIFVHNDQCANGIQIMKKESIRALPDIDAVGHIVDIYLAKNERSSYAKEKQKALTDVSVVIMAGGKGTRLYPYTKILPKPLIPIGEVPIVERVMDNFHEFGISDFLVTVNYKKGMIKSYFAEAGKAYHIEYVEEDKPLGTGGSLKLIKRVFDSPIFVANCDSLIRTDYELLYQHHLQTNNAITIVTALKNDTIPYGVVYSKEDGELDHMDEKPTRSYLINTGMYIINPEIIQLIPNDTMFHMTHLVDKAKELGYKVGMYPVSEDSFLDMGEFTEMKRMNKKLNIE